MANKKVIFFVAGPVPTVDEAADLAALQATQFDVLVRNASAALNYGPRLEACDFVAGSVPDSYSESPVWEGGGESSLPATLNAIGTLPFVIDDIAESATFDISAPDVYTIIEGVLSKLNPAGVAFTYGAIPGGSVPGFDGDVSFAGPSDSNMTGTTEGQALVSIAVNVGTAPDADSLSLTLYFAVTVTAAP